MRTDTQKHGRTRRRADGHAEARTQTHGRRSMDADARTQTQAPDGARTLNIRACSAWVEKSSRRVLRLDERTRTFEVYYIWCRCQYYISSQSKVSCMYYKQSIDILLTTGMYSIHIICTHVLITRSLYTLYAIAGLSRDSYRGGGRPGISPPKAFPPQIHSVLTLFGIFLGEHAPRPC